MSLKIVTHTLTAALAASGTFAIGYPSGTGPGHFRGGLKNKLATAQGDVFAAPKYFTLTFGASSITVTWGSASPTLASGTVVYVQLDMPGYKSDEARDTVDPPVHNARRMETLLLSLGSPALGDADGYAASQTVTGAGTAFVLNGALVVSGVGIADVPRNVVAAWTNTAVLTITGKDVYGNTMVEQSASGTSHTGQKAFAKITSITTSATVTSATVGTGAVLGLPVFVPAIANVVEEWQAGVVKPQKGGLVYVMSHALEAAVDGGTGLNMVSPVAGFVRRAYTMARDTITTGGAVTFEIATVAIDGLSVTIANSTSEGDMDTDDATYGHASTAVSVGSRIEAQFAAAIDGSSDLMVVVEIEATKATHGTFVAGVIGSAQSATSGDVRGTYSPVVTLDGTTSIDLVVRLADPDFLGIDQYAG